jgi:hypothetical protein
MEFRSLPNDLEGEGRKTFDSLVEGEASIYRLVILAGLLLVVQSFVGLLGICYEDKKVGGGCLRLYLASVFVTLLLFVGVFGGACYYIMNIDALIDRDWEGERGILAALQGVRLTSFSLSLFHSFTLSLFHRHSPRRTVEHFRLTCYLCTAPGSL